MTVEPNQELMDKYRSELADKLPGDLHKEIEYFANALPCKFRSEEIPSFNVSVDEMCFVGATFTFQMVVAARPRISAPKPNWPPKEFEAMSRHPAETAKQLADVDLAAAKNANFDFIGKHLATHPRVPWNKQSIAQYVYNVPTRAFTHDCTSCAGDPVLACGSCRGTGIASCANCRGYGYLRCGSCNGNGKYLCPKCSGAGRRPCSPCSNSGAVNCFSCGGHARINCRSCNGIGGHEQYISQQIGFRWIHCSTCGGLRTMPCWKCASGKVTCGTCGGRGNVGCGYCAEIGEVGCNRCAQTGHVGCNNCDRRGTVGCPICGSTGKWQCHQCELTGRQHVVYETEFLTWYEVGMELSETSPKWTPSLPNVYEAFSCAGHDEGRFRNLLRSTAQFKVPAWFLLAKTTVESSLQTSETMAFTIRPSGERKEYAQSAACRLAMTELAATRRREITRIIDSHPSKRLFCIPLYSRFERASSRYTRASMEAISLAKRAEIDRFGTLVLELTVAKYPMRIAESALILTGAVLGVTYLSSFRLPVPEAVTSWFWEPVAALLSAVLHIFISTRKLVYGNRSYALYWSPRSSAPATARVNRRHFYRRKSFRLAFCVVALSYSMLFVYMPTTGSSFKDKIGGVTDWNAIASRIVTWTTAEAGHRRTGGR